MRGLFHLQEIDENSRYTQDRRDDHREPEQVSILGSRYGSVK
jgi:hypothetical protein